MQAPNELIDVHLSNTFGIFSTPLQFNRRAAQKLKLMNGPFAPSVAESCIFCGELLWHCAESGPKSDRWKIWTKLCEMLKCAHDKITHVIWNIIIIIGATSNPYANAFFAAFSSLVEVKECHNRACIVCRAWIGIAAVRMLFHLVFIILCFQSSFSLSNVHVCRSCSSRRRYHRIRFGQSIINMLCLYEASKFRPAIPQIRELWIRLVALSIQSKMKCCERVRNGMVNISLFPPRNIK